MSTWVLLAFYMGSAYMVPGSYPSVEECLKAAQAQYEKCQSCRIEYRCREVKR